MSFQNKLAVFQCLREFLTEPLRFKSTSACIKLDDFVMLMLYKYLAVINYDNRPKSELEYYKDDFLDYDRTCHFCGEHDSEIIQIYKSKWYIRDVLLLRNKCGFVTLGFCNACFLGSNSEHEAPFLLTSSRDKCDHCENKDTYIVDDLFTGKTKTLCSNDHFYSFSPPKIVCASTHSSNPMPSPNPMKKIREEYLKHKTTKTSPTARYSRV